MKLYELRRRLTVVAALRGKLSPANANETSQANPVFYCKMKGLSCLLLFACVSFCLASDTEVRYVHLALTGNTTEMSVGWYTEDASKSTVRWGDKPGDYPFSAVGTSSEWHNDYGYNHFATIINLRPNTRYYYVCGDASGGWSREFSFKSAPVKGIYGDMGTENSQKTIDRVSAKMQNGEIDWIYHVGDISYADKHYFNFQKTWNSWFNSIQSISASAPYMVCPGNHEYEAYNPFIMLQSRNFVVYNARFRMPQSANSSHQNMYYSFDYGPVHFLSISTETSFDGAPFDDDHKFADQVAWVTEDLRVANLPENRKQRPWIFVIGHRPMYSSCDEYSSKGVPTSKSSVAIQKSFEDLFNKFKVDVLFNGHVHSYERNYPAYKNKRTGTSYVNPKNPFNIITGCAGVSHRNQRDMSSCEQSLEGLKNEHETKWDLPQPEWSAHRYGSDYGYGILTVTNGTHLDWKFYRVSDDGLEDSVVVQKSFV
ncbi:iron/zinc purple acid phosphatase-like protein-like isoform 1 [Planoprotostelium fungivorum]|uniref:Purple acid phosphatase n=1 Tax=Planoprotostelium fungivorum TaxID=1890364 RepID=A0A2P6NA57_9EUKA|nr:iron/zinc purple acid phosphatase-like protein-like isoform 1 [Planoprotostelium fungivorum]